MKKIKEAIVVEGKNDSAKLKKYYDVLTIETNGLFLNSKTIEYIRKMNDTNGVILLLDPDSAGEKIRKKLNDSISGLKNCFLIKKEARTNKKVGVEHASFEVIDMALKSLVTYCKDFEQKITYNDLLDLKLTGNNNSVNLRNKVGRYFGIGECNAKVFVYRLNMLGITKDELNKQLQRILNDL